MKRSSTEVRPERRDWLAAECEKLRQECNHLTVEQRRQARRFALKIIRAAGAR